MILIRPLYSPRCLPPITRLVNRSWWRTQNVDCGKSDILFVSIVVWDEANRAGLRVNGALRSFFADFPQKRHIIDAELPKDDGVSDEYPQYRLHVRAPPAYIRRVCPAG